jgi:hypothetical protein
VPLIARDFDVHSVQLFPAALYDAIKAYVVFKCVRSHDVVIVCICNADRYATGLIDLPGNRLEPQGNLDIFRNDGFKNGKRKTIVFSVGTGLLDDSTRERRWIVYDRPSTGAPFARSRKFKTGWGFSGFHLGNRNDSCCRLRNASDPDVAKSPTTAKAANANSTIVRNSAFFPSMRNLLE